jgi:hypothetical protein
MVVLVYYITNIMLTKPKYGNCCRRQARGFSAATRLFLAFFLLSFQRKCVPDPQRLTNLQVKQGYICKNLSDFSVRKEASGHGSGSSRKMQTRPDPVPDPDTYGNTEKKKTGSRKKGKKGK